MILLSLDDSFLLLYIFYKHFYAIYLENLVNSDRYYIYSIPVKEYKSPAKESEIYNVSPSIANPTGLAG